MSNASAAPVPVEPWQTQVVSTIRVPHNEINRSLQLAEAASG